MRLLSGPTGLQITAHTAPLFLSTSIALVVSWLAWRHAPRRYAATLALHVLAFAAWGGGQLLVAASTDLSWKMYGTAVTGIAVAVVFVTWLVFALQYAGRIQHAAMGTAGLCIIPALMAGVLLTNEPFGNHELVLTNPTLHSGPTYTFSYEPGVLAYLGAAYLGVLGLRAEHVLLKYYLSSRKPERKETALYLLVGLAAGLCLTTSFLGIAPFPHYTTTHYLYLVACGSITVPTVRSRVTRVLPGAATPMQGHHTLSRPSESDD